MAGKKQKGLLLGLTLCMSVLFCTPALAAQEPLFLLDIDTLNLQKGVSCTLVVTLANAQGAQIVNIEGLENFDVLSQSQSTSTSYVGQDMTYQENLYITLMPKATGQFSLQAIIQFGGQSCETNALEVTIREGGAGDEEALPDLFVKTVMSHTEAYLGEKVILTYELYTRYSVENFGLQTTQPSTA